MQIAGLCDSLAIRDLTFAKLGRIVNFIHEQGSIAGMQLAHAGRKGSARRHEIFHTSPLECRLTEFYQDFGTRLRARKIFTSDRRSAEGCVCPLSQFRIVVLSQPMIFARSFCSNPKSNRRLRIASPIAATSFGYALSFGFFPWRRTRQKSNATSGIHCCNDYELARDKMMPPAHYEFTTSEPTGSGTILSFTAFP